MTPVGSASKIPDYSTCETQCHFCQVSETELKAQSPRKLHLHTEDAIIERPDDVTQSWHFEMGGSSIGSDKGIFLLAVSLTLNCVFGK